jgi:hypothetical protein
VRGDIAVLKEHITAMGQLSPELSELYGSLGRVALQIAELKGELSQERLKQVASILTAPLGSETKT